MPPVQITCLPGSSSTFGIFDALGSPLKHKLPGADTLHNTLVLLESQLRAKSMIYLQVEVMPSKPLNAFYRWLLCVKT